MGEALIVKCSRTGSNVHVVGVLLLGKHFKLFSLIAYANNTNIILDFCEEKLPGTSKIIVLVYY